jgi:hypothetical protein
MSVHTPATSRLRPLFRRLVTPGVLAAFAVLLAAPGTSAAADSSFGTYLTPFSAASPWNSRPVAPKLDTTVIAPTNIPPSFGEGSFSSGVFLSHETDGPVTVTGFPGSAGLYESDSETFHDVTIAHWPSSVLPAAGSDGHADIVDPVLGIVHSFFQLRNDNGQWRATLYAWTRLDGRGWGDPAHYSQGSRAAAVPPTGGLIRTHEVADGDAMYRHALSVSLTPDSLSPNPTYVYPATSADSNASTTNHGSFPEGSLLMLPYAFDVRQIINPAVRKVAQTLKSYGAYVVDRNIGVPFVIYAENGSGLGALNNVGAADMERIRLALRRVTSQRGWLDGNNKVFTPATHFNLLSMRGPWLIQTGTAQGVFDTYAQALLIPATQTETTLVNFSTRGLTPLLWDSPSTGVLHRLTAETTGGAKLRLQLYNPANSVILFDSGLLQDGESITFPWPAQNTKTILYATSGVGQAGSVSGELLRVD